jgi:thiol:disulfide interchange protein DsbA
MRQTRRRSLLALLAFAAAAFTGPVLAADPRDGADYTTLPTPQPTDTGRKIEVIEFFAYYCPHCYAFEPALAAWVKKQGDNIVFKRVHVERGAAVLPQERLFYTLEAMGLLDAFHTKAFDAMHVEHLRLRSDEEVFDWAAKNGIDRARFADVYNSFGLQAKLRRTNAMMDAYGVDRWPMVVVDGRWITSPSHAAGSVPAGASEAQQQQAALQTMDWLVARAKANRG